MKKIILILTLIISFNVTFANPLIVPPSPIFSELYFDGDNWELEIIFHNFSYCYMSDLDSIRIITSTDTAMLKPSLNLQFDQIIVLTQDSLLSALHINKNGDFIRFQHFNQEWCDLVDPVTFGNCNYGVSYSYVNTPGESQSLVMLEFGYTGCFLALSNHPSIGLPNNIEYNIFSGRIVDINHNPVCKKSIIQCKLYFYNEQTVSDMPDYWIIKVHTDTTGQFYDTTAYARNFTAKLYIDSVWLFDSTFAITIQPDSANYYEFMVDTNELIFVNVEKPLMNNNFSLMSFPNPSDKETTISFCLPSNTNYSKAIIKIYDLNGEMVRILPVNLHNAENNYSVKWDGSYYNGTIASGIYYYNLELDGQKAAANKMIITK